MCQEYSELNQNMFSICKSTVKVQCSVQVPTSQNRAKQAKNELNEPRTRHTGPSKATSQRQTFIELGYSYGILVPVRTTCSFGLHRALSPHTCTNHLS